MSNLIAVTLPTMHFRRAPENLFATRRLYIYIYIYYQCQFYRFVSTSSIEGNRATVATIDRLLILKLRPPLHS